MAKLRTFGGLEFDCDYFNPSERTRQLNLRVLGETLVYVAGVFSRPEETQALRCDGQYAAGFTRLTAIVPEGNAIRVVLGKE